MEVVKAFAPGLICRGHKFDRNKVNKTPYANCVQNGWHAAEDPLDCLSYYCWDGKNEFYVCIAGGDIHEDGRDSKISCTELTIGERLTLERFIVRAIHYQLLHPSRKPNSKVVQEGEAANGFIIVRGKKPSAVGKKGDILGFILEDRKNHIIGVSLQKVGKGGIMPGVSYTLKASGEVIPDGRVTV